MVDYRSQAYQKTMPEKSKGSACLEGISHPRWCWGVLFWEDCIERATAKIGLYGHFQKGHTASYFHGMVVVLNKTLCEAVVSA